MIERTATRRFGRDRSVWGGFSRRMRLGLVLGLSIGALGLLAGLPGVAHAGDTELHELTWAHPSPSSVSRFIVFVSRTRGGANSARQVEVGKPAGSSSGTLQFYSAIVPVDHEEFVAVGAVDNAGNLGSMSEWSAVPPSRPGQPVVVEP